MEAKSAKMGRERKTNEMDFISSTDHVCFIGENEISEIKEHHTKERFNLHLALEMKKRLDRICLHSSLLSKQLKLKVCLILL